VCSSVVIIMCVSARARNSEAALVIQFVVLRSEGFMKLLYLTDMYRSGRERESWLRKANKIRKLIKMFCFVLCSYCCD